jgi:hypothetical protein
MGKWSPEYPSFEEVRSFIREPSFIDDFLTYMNSPRGELSAEVSETVMMVLERADVDARNRQIIWEDGKRLSISASAQRIHVEYPDFPMALIETPVIGWLEMEFAPPTYTPEQLDELVQLTEAWVEDHERQAEATKNGLELPTLEIPRDNNQSAMCSTSPVNA